MVFNLASSVLIFKDPTKITRAEFALCITEMVFIISSLVSNKKSVILTDLFFAILLFNLIFSSYVIFLYYNQDNIKKDLLRSLSIGVIVVNTLFLLGIVRKYNVIILDKL